MRSNDPTMRVHVCMEVTIENDHQILNFWFVVTRITIHVNYYNVISLHYLISFVPGCLISVTSRTVQHGFEKDATVLSTQQVGSLK